MGWGVSVVLFCIFFWKYLKIHIQKFVLFCFVFFKKKKGFHLCTLCVSLQSEGESDQMVERNDYFLTHKQWDQELLLGLRPRHAVDSESYFDRWRLVINEVNISHSSQTVVS